MLEKMVRIKNIGRFRDYAANGDVTFRKLTLIYAEITPATTAMRPEEFLDLSKL